MSNGRVDIIVSEVSDEDEDSDEDEGLRPSSSSSEKKQLNNNTMHLRLFSYGPPKGESNPGFLILPWGAIYTDNNIMRLHCSEGCVGNMIYVGR